MNERLRNALLLGGIGVALFLFSSRSQAASNGGPRVQKIQPVNRTVSSGGGGLFTSLLPTLFGGDDDVIADGPIADGSGGGGPTAGDSPPVDDSPPPSMDDDASDPDPIAPIGATGGSEQLPAGTRIGTNVVGDEGGDGDSLRVMNIGPRMNLF